MKLAAVLLLCGQVLSYNYTTKYFEVPVDHFR
jgi:hypothetical protein